MRGWYGCGRLFFRTGALVSDALDPLTPALLRISHPLHMCDTRVLQNPHARLPRQLRDAAREMVRMHLRSVLGRSHALVCARAVGGYPVEIVGEPPGSESFQRGGVALAEGRGSCLHCRWRGDYRSASRFCHRPGGRDSTALPCACTCPHPIRLYPHFCSPPCSAASSACRRKLSGTICDGYAQSASSPPALPEAPPAIVEASRSVMWCLVGL